MRKFKHKKSGWEAREDSHSKLYELWDLDWDLSFHVPNSMIEDCQDWEEVREPLFVTEDGVEVHLGDQYFFTYNGNCTKTTASKDQEFQNGVKNFSTKEAAEKWLYEEERRRILNPILEKHFPTTVAVTVRSATNILNELYDLIKKKQ